VPEPTVRKRQLGNRLRRLRTELGLRIEDVAERVDVTGSKLSRIESGRIGIKPADLDALLDLYGVDDQGLRNALRSIAWSGNTRGWWHQYRDIVSPAYADLISLENEADAMRTYQSTLIPGLLQTPAYARVTISATGMTLTDEEVDALVTVRMARQSALQRPNPLQLWAVIHEAALRPRIKGDPTIMREQLHWLLEKQKLPHVSIQVLPLDSPPHVGMLGSFATVGYPGAMSLDVVLIESLTTALYVEDAVEVSRYGTAFEHLRAAALPFGESADLIAQLKDST